MSTDTPAPGAAAISADAPGAIRATTAASDAATSDGHDRWPTWVAALIFLTATLGTNWTTLTSRTTETGDFAADSLRSRTAWSQVDGVFSRWDYHHPGPVLFWVKDVGESVSSPLGLDPAGGQMLAVAMLATLSLTALALVLGSSGVSRWCGPAILVIAWCGLPDGIVLVPWAPVMGNWFLVLGVAGLGASAIGARYGPTLVLLSAVALGQLHVLFAPLALALALALVLLVVRRRVAPATLWPAGLAVLAMLAPMAVAVVRDGGPWADYLTVAGDEDAALGSSWRTGIATVAVLVAPGAGSGSAAAAGLGVLTCLGMVVVGVLLVRRGGTEPVRLVGGAGVVGFAYLVVVGRMDFLTPETIGRVLPVMVSAGAVAWAFRRWPTTGLRVRAVLPVAGVCGLLVVTGVGRPPVEDVRREGQLRGDGTVEQALADAEATGSRLLVIDHDVDPWDSYAGAAALTLLAERRGVHHCVAARRWPLWAEPRQLCGARRGSVPMVDATEVRFTSPSTYVVVPPD